MNATLLSPDAKTRLYADLLVRIGEVAYSTMPREERLDFIVNLLRNDVPHYDWVGFYLVDPHSPRELVLDRYAGDATDHTRIAFGEGICGQAAERLDTFVVQDVSQESNYLSCSIHVKSEIVLPILHQGALVGELDIDSHTVAPFTPEDTTFLQAVCDRVAPFVGL
jgi:L-methionine (R)-S-oxide reductase